MNQVEIKIVIDGKDANATLVLTKENVDAIHDALGGVPKDVPTEGIRGLTRSTDAARMGVASLSQTLQSSTAFQYGFGMGLTAVGNNVENLVTDFTRLKIESVATGQSMSGTLLNVLTGPTGIMLGISAVVMALQFLPSLLDKTGEAAKKAADDGLQKFSDRLKNMTAPEKVQTVAELQKQIDLIDKAIKKNLITTTGGDAEHQIVSTTVLDPVLNEYLEKRLKINKDLLDTAKEEITYDKAIAAVAHEGNLAIDDKRSKLTVLNDELTKFRKMQDEGLLVDEQGVKLADRMEEAQREINLLKESSSDYAKKVAEAFRIDTEQKIKDAERKKEQQILELDNEEKKQLALATTDEQKQKIETDFAKKRIDLERDTAVAILGFQKLIAKARLKATMDPHEAYELRAQIKQIKKDIDAANATADTKKSSADANFDIEEASRKKGIAADNARYLAEKEVEEKRRQQQEDSKNFFKKMANEQLEDMDHLDEAKKKYAADEAKYLASTDAKQRETLKAQLDMDKQDINLTEDRILARQEEAKQNILAGAQEYDASQNLGMQLNRQANESIRRIIAEAVATQLGKVIAEIPFPFNLIAAPAAGIAVEALLERLIPKFSSGGGVFGESGVDKVHAMLTTGEFVVRKDVAQDNYMFLSALNSGQIRLPKYSTGGPVGMLPSMSALSSTELKKEFAALKKTIVSNRPLTVINSDTDWNRFKRGQDRSARIQKARIL